MAPLVPQSRVGARQKCTYRGLAPPREHLGRRFENTFFTHLRALAARRHAVAAHALVPATLARFRDLSTHARTQQPGQEPWPRYENTKTVIAWLPLSASSPFTQQSRSKHFPRRLGRWGPLGGVQLEDFAS